MAATGPLRKRLIGDKEIIERRAHGQTLAVIAEAAGIGVPTLSIWLRHPDIAEKVADAKHLIKLEAQDAKRRAAAQAKAAKAQKRRDREAAKPPEPPAEWDKDGGEPYDAYVARSAAVGRTGKVLLRRGADQLVTAAQQALAGLIARGATEAHCAKVFGISERTVRRWKKLPEVQAEMERVRANSATPDTEGVLIDALAARNDDGVNWPARIKAALELQQLRQPAPGSKGGGPNAGGGLIHMKVVMYECSKCGEMSVTPPPGFEPGEIIDAEEAVGVPGHGMLPPAPEPNW